MEKTYKAYFGDMSAIFYYDSLDWEYFMPNTGYVQILNTLKKLCTSITLNVRWLQNYDRYFKEDVGQSAVIVHYDNYRKLTPKQRTLRKQLLLWNTMYMNYYRLNICFVGPW